MTRRTAIGSCLALPLLLTPGCTAASDAGTQPGGTLPLPASSGRPVRDLPPGSVGFPSYPALSPDGSVLVFSWAGDLWAAPSRGGAASRLTAHPGDERRSVFSQDGSLLAFESDRDGARNLYVMPVQATEGGLVGGDVARVTTSDRTQTLGSFTADGKSLLFTALQEAAIHRSARMYRVDLRFDEHGKPLGGGPVQRLTDAFGILVRSTPSEQGGESFVFVRGNAGLERPKYRGSGNQDLYRLAGGGTFARLTADPANDSEPWPLADGSVVFMSSRDGQNNVWRLGRGARSEADAERLTDFAPSGAEVTIGHGVRDLTVSASGNAAAFVVWDRLYTLDLTAPGARARAVDVQAGTDSAVSAMERLNLEKEVTEAALSPDGKTLAVVARGEVFVRNTQEGYPTRRVTDTPGREKDLAWSPDGRVLYFASDDAGVTVEPAPGGTAAEAGRSRSTPGLYGIYAASVTLAREDLKPEKKEPPVAAPEQKAKEEPASGSGPEPGTPEPKQERAAGESGDDPEPAKTDADASDKKPAAADKPKGPDYGKRWSEALRFAIEPVAGAGADAHAPVPSPDGKKLLYTRGLGDLVVLDLTSGAGRERTVVRSWNEPDAVWAADSRHIAYAVSDLDYNSDIWLMDLGADPASEAPAAVPAGEQGRGEEGKTRAEAGERRWPNPVNLTRHPDDDRSPRLSADGKVLVFLSDRSGENGEFDVWAIALDKEIEAMTGYERDEYFKKAAEAAGKRKPLGAPAGDAKKAEPKPGGEAKAGGDAAAEPKAGPKSEAAAGPTPEKPLGFDAEDAYLRASRVTSMPGSEANLVMTPGGDRIVFVGTVDAERALLSVDHKGGDRKALQTGDVSGVGVSLTGEKAVFVRAGQAASVNAKAGGKADPLAIDAPVVIDTARQQRQKFLEAARLVGSQFYHPTLKGLDWDALTARYLDLAVRTRTNDEFNRVGMLLFGELNGSHLGMSGGPGYSAPSPATGYLGVRATPVADGFRIEQVTLGSPADSKTARLKRGDVVVAIDGKALSRGAGHASETDLDAALAGKAGKEVLVEVRRAPATGDSGAGGAPSPAGLTDRGTEYLLMVPVSAAAWDTLGYQHEVLQRRAEVERLSGGRLGYLHIRAMGGAAVRDFERDLYAAAQGKEGLIIDVRDNGGGSTADILLSSLTAPVHAYTVPRGADPKAVPHDAYPRDRRLIYGWGRPINVLINQNSFSNAEIFAHAIKTTGRGRLVGTPTFGGVISTDGTTLIDGTFVRLPQRGWYLPDGRDMENNGAVPDVAVAVTPEDEVAGRDPQLEAAVEELLERVGSKAAGR